MTGRIHGSVSSGGARDICRMEQMRAWHRMARKTGRTKRFGVRISGGIFSERVKGSGSVVRLPKTNQGKNDFHAYMNSLKKFSRSIIRRRGGGEEDFRTDQGLLRGSSSLLRTFEPARLNSVSYSIQPKSARWPAPLTGSAFNRL